MHRKRTDSRLLRQAALQRFPFVAAVGEAEQPGIDDPARSGLTGKSEVQVGGTVGLAVAAHGLFLPLADFTAQSPFESHPTAQVPAVAFPSLALPVTLGKTVKNEQRPKN